MIRLPTFTFLSAPAGSGKTTLSDLLRAQDPGLCVCSFAEPLRQTLLSTFYPECLTSGLDLRDPDVKKQIIPGTPGWTNRQFLIDYGNWLKVKTNDRIIGDLAKRSVSLMTDYYVRFVFDDARTIGDVAPFIDGYGAENCLLIHIERPGFQQLPGDVGANYPLNDLPGIKHARLQNNAEPEYMLRMLAIVLGGTVDSTVTPTVEDL